MKNSDNSSASDGGAMKYHIPVLLHECIQALNIRPDGVYIDATFGGGGHSQEILRHLGPEGRLLAFDQDKDAVQNTMDDERFTLLEANFRYYDKFLRLHGIEAVDGILADLGVSSHQLDTAERGFSHRFSADLDMRMNQQQQLTAAHVLNTYDAEALQTMWSRYAELRNAKTLAQHIVEQRRIGDILTTAQLSQLCRDVMIGEPHKYLSQVYQALRIEVNDELGALQDFLKITPRTLKSGGRLAVITFHSLEDKLVKNFMRYGTFDDEPEKDFFGRTEIPFKLVNKKPVEASPQESKNNPRSRSAKLRIAEKR